VYLKQGKGEELPPDVLVEYDAYVLSAGKQIASKISPEALSEAIEQQVQGGWTFDSLIAGLGFTNSSQVPPELLEGISSLVQSYSEAIYNGASEMEAKNQLLADAAKLKGLGVGNDSEPLPTIELEQPIIMTPVAAEKEDGADETGGMQSIIDEATKPPEDAISVTLPIDVSTSTAEGGNSPEDAGQEVADTYSKAISDGAPTAQTAASTLGSAGSTIPVDYTAAYNSGVYAGQGFVQGLLSMIAEAQAAAGNLGAAAVQKLKSVLGIESPSKVLFELGEFTGEGYARGIENTLSRIAAAARMMAGEVSEGAGYSQARSYEQVKQPAAAPSGAGNLNQYITINSPTELSPAKTARELKIASINLANA
jgi:hypothetical protein